MHWSIPWLSGHWGSHTSSDTIRRGELHMFFFTAVCIDAEHHEAFLNWGVRSQSIKQGPVEMKHPAFRQALQTGYVTGRRKGHEFVTHAERWLPSTTGHNQSNISKAWNWTEVWFWYLMVRWSFPIILMAHWTIFDQAWSISARQTLWSGKRRLSMLLWPFLHCNHSYLFTFI